MSLPRGPKKADKRKASGGSSSSNGKSNSSSLFGAKGSKKAKFSFIRPADNFEKEKQSFLDFGQKSFGANKNCKLCGMFFVIGDVEDENRHRSFCQKSSEALTIPNLKQHRALETWEEKDTTSNSIIEIKSHESQKIESDALVAILDMVQNELGSTLTLLEESSESILLHVCQNKVVGCVVKEAVCPSKLIELSSTKGTTDVDLAHDLDGDLEEEELELGSVNDLNHGKSKKEKEKMNIEDQKESVGASALAGVGEKASGVRPASDTLGVKLIWVHKSRRRMGVAKRLLDAARKHFEYGRVVKKHHVAFSQPTSDGMALALSYTAQKTIWGYA